MAIGPADATRPAIGVTIGDATGIGPEVLARALLQTRLTERVDVRLFVAETVAPWLRQQWLQLGLAAGQSAHDGLTWVEVGVPPGQRRGVAVVAGQPDVTSRGEAFVALEALTAAAVRGELAAVVTGPVPKGIFDHLQPRPPGQTEYLAAQLGAPRFAMMLAGPRLRVVPVTTHVPLQQVPSLLTIGRIVETTLAADDALRRWMDIASPRLAVCGLNPHAGEDGRLGDEEGRIIAPAVAELQRQGVRASGPVVADSVFHHALQGRYDAVICMYHDQALGPLKTVHFHDAVNLTCGLPVPRLSPDHGTAYDIAGQGIADPTSMAEALRRAEHMARRTASRGRKPHPHTLT